MTDSPDRPELRETRDGVILPVRARAGARLSAITGVHAGRLRLTVRQAPEKGRANTAIIDLLARRLGLKRSAIRLIGGTRSSDKSFLIHGVRAAELRDRIAGCLGEA